MTAEEEIKLYKEICLKLDGEAHWKFFGNCLSCSLADITKSGGILNGCEEKFIDDVLNVVKRSWKQRITEV